MPTFRVTSLPNSKNSMFENPKNISKDNFKAYNIYHSFDRSSFTKLREKIFNTNHLKHDNSSLVQRPVAVYYDASQIDQHEIGQTLLTSINNNGHEAVEKSKSWRHKTKHRTVVSNATCYGTGFSEEVQPFEMIIATGCAPNFSKVDYPDMAKFFEKGILKEADLKATLKLLYKQWLYVLTQHGADVCIFPFVGSGIYLDCLNDEDKITVKQLNLQAFKEAIEEVNPKAEIVLALPNTDRANADRQSPDFTMAENIFSQNYRSSTSFSIVNGDIFSLARAATMSGKKPGILNPGSDRVIGGQMLDCTKTSLEEIIATLTDMAFYQSSDFNRNFNYQVYPDSLSVNPRPSTNMRLFETRENNALRTETKQAVEKIKAYYSEGYKLNIVDIIEVDGNKKVFLDKHESAASLITILLKQGMGNSRDNNRPKTLQTDSMTGRPFVMLTARQYNGLLTAIQATEQAINHYSGRNIKINTITELDDGNKKVLLEEYSAANNLTKILFEEHGIGSVTDRGYPKRVQKDGESGKPFIVLSQRQYDRLLEKISANTMSLPSRQFN